MRHLSNQLPFAPLACVARCQLRRIFAPASALVSLLFLSAREDTQLGAMHLQWHWFLSRSLRNAFDPSATGRPRLNYVKSFRFLCHAVFGSLGICSISTTLLFHIIGILRVLYCQYISLDGILINPYHLQPEEETRWHIGSQNQLQLSHFAHKLPPCVGPKARPFFPIPLNASLTLPFRFLSCSHMNNGQHPPTFHLPFVHSHTHATATCC